jgi:hypothetical protein
MKQFFLWIRKERESGQLNVESSAESAKAHSEADTVLQREDTLIQNFAHVSIRR